MYYIVDLPEEVVNNKDLFTKSQYIWLHQILMKLLYNRLEHQKKGNFGLFFSGIRSAIDTFWQMLEED